MQHETLQFGYREKIQPTTFRPESETSVSVTVLGILVYVTDFEFTVFNSLHNTNLTTGDTLQTKKTRQFDILDFFFYLKLEQLPHGFLSPTTSQVSFCIHVCPVSTVFTFNSPDECPVRHMLSSHRDYF